jgi:hypothetical protein
MNAFKDFLDAYFFQIWLGIAISLTLVFFFQGRAVLRKFGPVDFSKAIFIDNYASGYSPRAANMGKGGARKVLHIIVTDKELITTTYLMLAYIARRTDLMQRIPLERIRHVELKRTKFFEKLVVRFETAEGKLKDLVLSSKNNLQLKAILDEYVKD